MIKQLYWLKFDSLARDGHHSFVLRALVLLKQTGAEIRDQQQAQYARQLLADECRYCAIL